MFMFFATCAKNLENLLREELQTLGAESLKETVAGVYFQGPIEIAYKACLWSRLANHILLQLSQFKISTESELYDAVQTLNWSEHLDVHQTLAVQISGSHPAFQNTLYAAQRVKDAIVDQFRSQTGERPSVQNDQPDILINLHLDPVLCSLSLSLSGESLHRRGYHLESGKAPLKETLAAALLLRAGWLKELAKPHPVLLDPMCGTGTFLIEAALMAYDIAPGLYRNYFGFLNWKQHQNTLWSQLVQTAETRKTEGLASRQVKIIGSDIHRQAVIKAHENIDRAGLADQISVSLKDCVIMNAPENPEPGLIICNPPYGERMNAQDLNGVSALFSAFGERLREKFVNWKLAFFSGAPTDCNKAIGIRPDKIYAFLNGTIPCQLILFSIQPESFLKQETPQEKQARQIKVVLDHGLSEGAQMFQNRLIKNLKHLKKQIFNSPTPLFRIYDKDLPDYAVMIDLETHNNTYQAVHVREYQAPSHIDPKKINLRLKEILAVLHLVLNLPSEKILVSAQKELTNSMKKYQNIKK